MRIFWIAVVLVSLVSLSFADTYKVKDGKLVITKTVESEMTLMEIDREIKNLDEMVIMEKELVNARITRLANRLADLERQREEAERLGVR